MDQDNDSNDQPGPPLPEPEVPADEEAIVIPPPQLPEAVAFMNNQQVVQI